MNHSLLPVLILSFLISARAFPAPVDFDGDGTSEPSLVVNSLLQNGSPGLDWLVTSPAGNQIILSGFGQPGVLLAPGHYTQETLTEPGFISSDGTWTVRGNNGSDYQFVHGEANAAFVIGADIDGNGESDALYYTNACKHRRTMILARLNPVDNFLQLAQLKSGRGKYYIAFGDVDGDGSDEACSLTPGISGGKFTRNFFMVCQDFFSGKVVSRFRVDKVFEPPIPVDTKLGKDVFVFPKHLEKTAQTELIVRSSSGAKLAEITLSGSGPVLVGHYTNSDGDAEQVAVAGEGTLSVWDIGTNVVGIIPVSAGTLFDEYGVERFESDDDCFCTSRNIGKSKNCRRLFSGGTSGGGGSTSGGGGSSGGQGASCPGGSRTPSGGALWKPQSDFAPGPRFVNAPRVVSSSCRYETSDGSVFMQFRSNGFGNPIGGVERQHWNPLSEVGCSSYPPGRIHCNNSCWSIPSPCTRFE